MFYKIFTCYKIDGRDKLPVEKIEAGSNFSTLILLQIKTLKNESENYCNWPVCRPGRF
jgi:hypothetical protein